jgi:hypothetical protein
MLKRPRPTRAAVILACVREVSRCFGGAMAWIGVVFGVHHAQADTLESCIRAAESAQEERSHGKLADARADLSVCNQEACPAAVRADCGRWSIEIEKEQPRLMLHAHGRAGTPLTNVRVRVDGVVVKQSIDGTAIPVDPGSHRLEFEANGFSPRQERVEMRQPGVQEMTIVLDELPVVATPQVSKGSGPLEGSAVLWIAGGTAVTGLLGFTYFGVRARSLASTLDSCAPHCNPADVQTLRTRAYLADGFLGVGIIGAGVTAWWLLRPASAPSAKQSFLIVPTDRGVTARVTASF